MFKRIGWPDLLVFGGIPLLTTIAMIGAAVTPQEWDAAKLIISITVPLAMWLGFVIFVINRVASKPTYKLSLGAEVWTNGIDIPLTRMQEAIKFYVDQLNASGKVDKNHNELMKLMGKLQIEFVQKRFTTIFYGKDKKYAGIQKDNYLKVAWLDGFHLNAFFHECHHYIDQTVRNKVDYKHEDKAWWDMIPAMKTKWSKSHV